MDEDRKRKILAFIWRERLRSFFHVAGAFLVTGLLFGLYMLDVQYSKISKVTGTVKTWSRIESEIGLSGYSLLIILPNGKSVVATADQHGRAPIDGEKVTLIRYDTYFGRVSYGWKR